MAIADIQRRRIGQKRTEEVIVGHWPAFSSSSTEMRPSEFREMIDTLREAEMEEAPHYEQELRDYLHDAHKVKSDYDTLTGQPKPGTRAVMARNLLRDVFDYREEDLYNPLHDSLAIEGKLPSGPFHVRHAIAALKQIPGVEIGRLVGHDVELSYKGRKRMLTAGSRNPGETDRNAVDSIIKDLLVEQDVANGHIFEENREKRIRALKESLYQ